MVMTNTKKIGIYLDHAVAHLVEYIDGTRESKIIASQFTHERMVQSLNRSEKVMHNMEDHEQAEYYKVIRDEIRSFDFILLFGPTEAKSELHNILRADHQFETAVIVVKHCDKMTEPEIHTYVREYFSIH